MKEPLLRRRCFAMVLMPPFVVGLAAGAGLDQLWLRCATRPSGDPRLLGEWERADGLRVEFRPDGIMEECRLVADGPPGRPPRREQLFDPSQYRWVDDQTIEIGSANVPDWVPLRVVFDGGVLILQHTTGSADRYTRVR